MPAPETAIPGEAELTALMATVYRAVDWRKQGGSNVLERWASMVLVASRAPTIGAFANTLCNRLGVGFLPDAALPLIAACRPHERVLLDLLGEESVPLAAAAYRLAKETRAK